MHERTAVVVRTAIDQTIDQLEGLDAGTPLSDMLVEHLGVLLKMEKEMLSEVQVVDEPCDHSIQKGDTVKTSGWQLSELHVVDVNHALRVAAVRLGPTGDIVVWPLAGMVKVAPTEKPWYPDDSGQWVETHGVDPELSDRLRVQLLAEIERDRKMHIPTAFLPSVVNWPRIVAYKVVSS